MSAARLRGAAAGVLALLALLSGAAAAGAQSPLDDTARLQGTYALSGQITVARGIFGEYPGLTVLRSWTFTPQCASGACETIALTRQRASGTDTVLLQLTASNQYTGSGSFYAPLRCRRRTYPRGQFVPFTISLQITSATLVGDVPVANQITASYTNRRRINRTRCVAAPAHDAALYQGSFVSGP